MAFLCQLAVTVTPSAAVEQPDDVLVRKKKIKRREEAHKLMAVAPAAANGVEISPEEEVAHWLWLGTFNSKRKGQGPWTKARSAMVACNDAGWLEESGSKVPLAL